VGQYSASAEILELLTRITELERKLDALFRHSPVHERKKIEGRWFVRLKVGGTDDDPFLSPWVRSKNILRASTSGRDRVWRAAQRASALAPRTSFSTA
jgi:hypothetical protein